MKKSDIRWLCALAVSVSMAVGAVAYRLSRNAAPTPVPAAYAVGERLAAAPRPSANVSFQPVEWDALMPADWDAMAPLKGLDLNALSDEDARAQLAMIKARKWWRDAPVEPRWDGVPVRIVGFAVSLGGEGESMDEFLLVPYFGACIHTPPPPANQVIHIKTAKPVPFRTMDAVWISGVLRVERADTLMGEAAYSLRADAVEAYGGAQATP
ncbi:MAG: DUF3299 domain-containing protein [Rhodocyclaceae bacterium]